MRLLTMAELRTIKGVSYSRPHLFRLIKADKFPAPVKLGENRNAWVEAEVDEWIDGRIASRSSEREQTSSPHESDDRDVP